MAILTVKRIGNRLGVLFPRDLVVENGIREHDRIRIDLDPGSGIDHLIGTLARLGLPSAWQLNRETNEGESL